MPTLEEILRKAREQRDSQTNTASSDNVFFPKGGGLLSKTLGSLALVFGAPARAVQGGILAGARDEDVVQKAIDAGLGYGSEGWGRGEVASGLELLEEAGLVEDKDNWGNIAAGIGVDVATDIATFNFIGAGKTDRAPHRQTR